MIAASPATESPFDSGHAKPWARTFLDVPQINARVTDTITSSIIAVRSAAQTGAELSARSLLVLGAAGAGKTHLFDRLRRRLGPRASFVHLRPLVGTEMTPRHVLGQIVQQLKNETYETATQPGGLRQLEALVGSSLGYLERESPDYPRMFLDELRSLDEPTRRQKIDWAVEQMIERHPTVDEMYLARLLAAPFMRPPEQRAALAWLAGQELEEAQARRIGVAAGLAEDRTLMALQTLGVFAAPGAPIVLVFDQLENLIDPDGTGGRIRAYANLVAELFDTMRGLVIVQMALHGVWQGEIQPQLSEAQRTRLNGDMLHVELPSSVERRELIRIWVDQLPTRTLPFPWPFSERQVARWCEAPGMTPRKLMIECRQALALGPSAPLDPPEETPADGPTVAGSEDGLDDALAAAWDAHLVKARTVLDEAAVDRRGADASRLVGGMACALRVVPGASVKRVDARQPVQIIAQVEGRATAVVLLHQCHPRSVITSLERAAESLGQGSVLVLRERSLEFPPTWTKVNVSRAEVTAKGVGWLTLERDETAKLLALESFLASARSRDLEDGAGRPLEEREVLDWVVRALQVGDWAFVHGLGRPERTEARGSEDEPPAPVAPAVRAGKPGRRAADPGATVRACLARLRLASVDRLLREVSRAEPRTTRVEVMSALEAMPEHVRWLGGSIVAVREEP